MSSHNGKRNSQPLRFQPEVFQPLLWHDKNSGTPSPLSTFQHKKHPPFQGFSSLLLCWHIQSASHLSLSFHRLRQKASGNAWGVMLQRLPAPKNGEGVEALGGNDFIFPGLQKERVFRIGEEAEDFPFLIPVRLVCGRYGLIDFQGI